MSSNDSAASTEPPLKRIKVEHTSEGTSVRESAEVRVDGTSDGDDGAVLAACSAGAIVQDTAARALSVSVKVEQGIEATETELTAGLPEPVLSLDDQAQNDAILAACSAGAIVQNVAARAREVTVKVEEGVEAGEAERAAALPKPVLAVGDRLEIFWEGENDFYAGTVVGVKGGMVKIVYDNGDEGIYDIEKEVWRVEGDGAGAGEEEEEGNYEEGREEEDGEEDEEEGEKEEDGSELDQEEVAGRAKKQASGSWHRCGVGGCDYKSKHSGNLKKHKAFIHGIGVQWFKCDQCAYKCKEHGHLKQHKASVHGIDVKWYKCGQCEFKSKVNSNLKVHKANIHGIDVKWFKCDECSYKCKENGNLKRHKAVKL